MALTASEYARLSLETGSVFTPGSPINERDLFAGRVAQVQKILDTVSQRGYHALLYGERGIGKTSLSNVLSSFLHEAGRSYLLPRVSCDASDDFTSIWKKMFRDIVTIESRPGVGFTAEEVQVTRRIVDGLPPQLTPDNIRQILLKLSVNTGLLLVFDEYDRLTDKKAAVLMSDTIKLLSDSASPATVLLVVVADSVTDIIKEHEPIERILVQIPVLRMSIAEVKQIVINGINRLAMNIDDAALDRIAHLSQGLPYVTHLLSLYSARAALSKQKKTIDDTDVESGIKEALDQWQQLIKTAYYDAIRSPQSDDIYKEVLLGCALAEVDDLGYFTPDSAGAPLRIITGRSHDTPDFSRHLNEFTESGHGNLLERVGTTRTFRYRFRSPLMRPYIVMRSFSENLLTKEQMHAIGSE